MITHYFLVAIRNLKTHWHFATMSIGCLVIGFTLCIITMNFVVHEKNYDNFHEKADDIYRLEYKVLKKTTGEVYQKWAVSPFPLGQTLKDNFPEVKDFARLKDPQLDAGEHTVSRGDKFFYEDKIYFVDPSFLKMFSFKLISGDVNTALDASRSVVLTQSASRRYFGDENPLGKELEFKHRTKTFNCVVTGVMEDIPSDSHLQFEMLASMETYYYEHTREALENWHIQALYTFIQLNPGVSPEDFENRSNELIESRLPAWKRENHHIDYTLRPFQDIHLYSDCNWDIAIKGNLQDLVFIFLLGVGIMIIGWVNYMNINIVHSIRRVKEFGLRKVLGAENLQQTLQIGVEFSITFFFSLLVSLILVIVLQGKYETIIGKPVPIVLFDIPLFWIILVLVFVVGVTLTVLFPFIIIKVIKPSIIVSGRTNFSSSKSGITLRRVLVGVQFVLAFFFLIFTASVFNQINFMRGQSLGYNPNNIIVINGPLSTYDSAFLKKLDFLKFKVSELSMVESVTVSEDVPGYELTWNTYVQPYKSLDGSLHSLYRNFIDENFLKTFQLSLLAGTDFVRGSPSGMNKFIINEHAMKLLNFKKPEDAIGKKVLTSAGQLYITGVVADHHQESLKKKRGPIAYFFDTDYKHPIYMSVKVLEGDKESSINQIKTQWETVFPDLPMDYFLLTDRINASYGNEKAFASTIENVTLFILLLACVGIFALSYFEVLSSLREIAIRKVLGSSSQALFFRSIAKTVKIILVSYILAISLSYFVLNQWLQNYEYKAPILPGIFIASGLVVFIIVMLTISYHTAKAVRRNPVNALHDE